jgi:DNA-binding CsgD family transcriptional regulator
MGAGIAKNTLISRISEAEDVSTVLGVMYDSCLKIGGDKFSYHPEIMFEGVASARSRVFALGYSTEWMKLYFSKEYRLIDPIPDLIMKIGRPMTWQEALSRFDLDAKSLALIEEGRRYGIVDGLGFPLWGPRGNNAYVAIGFRDNVIRLSPDAIRSEHMLLMAGHQKIQEVISATTTTATLSERELQVLTWISRGKSNNDVAVILNISPDTVATYKRRIYGKLGSNDRVDATIKALRLGLIRM